MTSTASTSALFAPGTSKSLTNKDADWQSFDPESYFQHYYGEPHHDDEELTCLVARALRDAHKSRLHGAHDPKLRSAHRSELRSADEQRRQSALASRSVGLDVVDVGTGPSLIPLLAALPVASSLTAWEFAEPNLSWLADELASTTLRPQWQHFWSSVQSVYSAEQSAASRPLPKNPLPLLADRVRLMRGSIFDLPRHGFDAATMFFCAESITDSRAEFRSALSAFTGTVRPGGFIAAAFLAGSSGYEVSGRRFPAVLLNAQDIAADLGSQVEGLEISPIGIRTSELRSGYSGAIFVTARIPF